MSVGFFWDFYGFPVLRIFDFGISWDSGSLFQDFKQINCGFQWDFFGIFMDFQL